MTLHPLHHAKARPDHPAIVMAGSGETVSYAADGGDRQPDRALAAIGRA